jgi:N-acetylneuraminate synthase/N,N'-diacetyllegionaminate synthase
MGETGLPTVISTGMATLAEIDEAVRAFRATGNPNLMLLHCVSCYPTPAKETNLARIRSLARVFGCPVGFSDHTQGPLAAVLSVAFGACLIEKHFTLQHDLPGPDHWFSVTPAELADLVKTVRDAESMIGTGTLAPIESEKQGRQDYRLSCVAASNLPQGHRLGAQDIVYRRPGYGVAPGEANWLRGRTLLRAVRRGHVFIGEDLA